MKFYLLIVCGAINHALNLMGAASFILCLTPLLLTCGLAQGMDGKKGMVLFDRTDGAKHCPMVF